MLNKKFMGIVACVVTFASLTMLAGTLACAEEKRPKAPSLPVCPTCKSEATTHIRGKVTAPVVMNCPDCKKETTEFGVYHCSKELSKNKIPNYCDCREEKIYNSISHET